MLIDVGALVLVQSRTTPGINKPGGVGRVVAVGPAGYSIKYVLDGSTERDVAKGFVSLHTFEDNPRRTSRQNVTNTAQPRSMKVQSLDASEKKKQRSAAEGMHPGAVTVLPTPREPSEKSPSVHTALVATSAPASALSKESRSARVAPAAASIVVKPMKVLSVAPKPRAIVAGAAATAATPALSPPTLTSTSPDDSDVAEANKQQRRQPDTNPPQLDSVKLSAISFSDPACDINFENFSKLLSVAMRGKDRILIAELAAAVKAEFPDEALIHSYLRRLDAENRIMTTKESIWAV